MKVYVSSTFVDLREHRAAAIKVLRQLGHEVVAMEDYVADSAVPLKKVLTDVAGCDAYVGIFAWRYGYMPGARPDSATAPANPAPGNANPVRPLVPEGLQLPPPGAAAFGTTSITEWEYLKAKQHGCTILSFLLEDGVPWPPHLCDGAAVGTTNANIQRLRRELTEERLVAYFSSPADLGQKVSTAITVANMSRQMGINLLTPNTDPKLQIAAFGPQITDSGKAMFADAIISAQSMRVVRIDIATEWWSTRLFLLAYLMQRLTEVRRVLVELSAAPPTADEPRPAQFCALLSTETIQRYIAPMHTQIGQFLERVAQRATWPADLKQEATALIEAWTDVIKVDTEQGIQTRVTPPNLKRWFGDAMLSRALHIPDLSSASAFDIARLVDYPSDFVPITTFERVSPAQPAAIQTSKVVDKAALESQLARTYLGDLLNRSGVRL